ncbi:MAG: ribokinase [Phycisphaerae bacterium]|nr:ribokinase [Phycisphaerae bacterium]
MPQSPDVVVIGSINMDLVLRVDRAPGPGETVLARDLATIPGGKGANQAVAVARLGASCALVGRVGDDDFGSRLLVVLEAAGVDIRHVTVTEGHSTGVAMITVDRRGENAICVAGGANLRLSVADIEAAADLIAHAKVCILQLETPIETVLRAIDVCREHEVESILDTAPAPDRPPAGLFRADILTPNIGEAARLVAEHGDGRHDAKVLAAAIAARGARRVVIKMGEHGALAHESDLFTHIPAHRIVPVDTTAAGDAFTAALAIGRLRGDSLDDAARLANAAGAAACLKFGAQPSLPHMADVLNMTLI